MAVRVVTDSACDLPPEMCEQLGIEVVPLTIRFGDREYVDRKELTTDEFWQQLESSSVLPETAAPSVGAFEETFRAPARRRRRRHRLRQPVRAPLGDDAVGAGRGQGARRAVPDRDHRLRDRVDGHRHPRAARGAARAPKAPTSRRSRARSTTAATARSCSRRSTRSSTCRKGGRIGGAQAMLGSMLSIKPIITVIDGAVEQAGKVRTRSKALRSSSTGSPRETSSRSACCTPARADLDEFLELVQPKVPGAEIVVGHIGPVVGVHVGPARDRADLDRARRLTPRRLGSVRRGEGRRCATTSSPRRPRRATAPRSTRCCAATRAWCTRSAGACSRNAEDALDATQEALLAIARRIDTFDGRSQFTTWCYRVATNAALDEARRRARRPAPVEIVPEPRVAGRPLDDAVADQLDVDAALGAALARVTAPRSRCGISSASTTPRSREVLDIPPGTVRSRIARGRAALADHLGRPRDRREPNTPFGTSNLTSTMNTPDQPLSPETLDELLSADLDGELERAAAELGFTLDDAARRARRHARRRRAGATRSRGPATCSPRSLRALDAGRRGPARRRARSRALTPPRPTPQRVARASTRRFAHGRGARSVGVATAAAVDRRRRRGRRAEQPGAANRARRVAANSAARHHGARGRRTPNPRRRATGRVRRRDAAERASVVKVAGRARAATQAHRALGVIGRQEPRSRRRPTLGRRAACGARQRRRHARTAVRRRRPRRPRRACADRLHRRARARRRRRRRRRVLVGHRHRRGARPVFVVGVPARARPYVAYVVSAADCSVVSRTLAALIAGAPGLRTPRLAMYAAPPRPRRDEDMSDWTTDAANAIDNAVGLVRERTVEPVQAVVRAVDLRPARRARAPVPQSRC